MAQARSILMCGKDAALLEVRSLVLSSAGFEVAIAERADEVRRLLSEDAGRFCVLVICHTQHEEELCELDQVASDATMPVLKLRPFVHPEELVREVKRRCEGGSVGSYRNRLMSVTDTFDPTGLVY